MKVRLRINHQGKKSTAEFLIGKEGPAIVRLNTSTDQGWAHRMTHGDANGSHAIGWQWLRANVTGSLSRSRQDIGTKEHHTKMGNNPGGSAG